MLRTVIQQYKYCGIAEYLKNWGLDISYQTECSDEQILLKNYCFWNSLNLQYTVTLNVFQKINPISSE